MPKQRTLLSLVQGSEPTKMINVRVPISLYDKALGQILKDLEAGNRKAGWTEVVIAGLERYVETPPRRKKK